MNTRRMLSDVRAPDEAGAQERAWVVVRSAYVDRAPSRSRGRRPVGQALGLGVALLVGALALSPAGAKVGGLITRALGVQHPARALFSLPAPGRLLVSGPGGTWTVAADGATRRVGAWRQAAWSPHGLFIVAAGEDRLIAIDPHGNPRWALPRRAVSDPQWFAPSGFRIAYRAGRDLRVVAGDGTGDRLLARDVAGVAPAWRPDHPYELAYVTGAGALTVLDADSGRTMWSTHPGARPTKLVWSADGSRLLALARTGAWVYDGAARPPATVVASLEAPIVDGSLSPDGASVALVRAGAAGDVAVAKLRSLHPPPHAVLSGAGITKVLWSPNGQWLLVSWPAADQWVFVRVTGRPRIEAYSRISGQLGKRGTFPLLEGWCCTATGTTG
jgi:hypothetical protein